MRDEDMTPAGAIRAWWQWFPVWTLVLAAVLVAGGLVTWGGSEFGWWLDSQAATHRAVATQNGYSNQATLRQQVTSLIAQVATISTQIAAAGDDQSMTASLGAQRMAIAGQACGDAEQVTDGLPAGQQEWAARNCSDGSVSLTSPYFQAGQP